jgi:UDP-N-acetylglucosamine diphosphorylase/glucosamine-1-phosphate N-acetyltransferase
MPETNTKLQSIILAAGKGTRMKSDLPKVLHEVAGRSLLAHVLHTARAAGIGYNIVVVGHKAELVRESCEAPDVCFVLQEPQLGTGHAVQVTQPRMATDGHTVILAGDVPLLRPETISRLVQQTVEANAAAAVLTCVVPDAGAYGRIVKNDAGDLLGIVEARDATPEQLAIGEYNTGVFCFRTKDLIYALDLLTTDNDQGEYYLTDTIEHLVADNRQVLAVAMDDPDEVVGINTVDQLQDAERIFLSREQQS